MGIGSVTRRNEIVSRVLKNGEVSVSELVDAFDVSEVTIRRDLEELEGRGVLLRTYGGAVKKEENEIGSEFLFGEKKLRNLEAKRSIAEAAMDFVKPGETVFLDSGTTTLEIARFIREKNIDVTVVSNSLPLVIELIHSEKANIFLLGGFLRRKLFDFYGPFLKDEISNLSINKAFLGVDAISGKFGLTTTDSSTGQIEEAVIANSCEIVVVADSSKIGKVALIPYGKSCARNLPCTLITDTGADEAELKEIEKLGFAVKTVAAGSAESGELS